MPTKYACGDGGGKTHHPPLGGAQNPDVVPRSHMRGWGGKRQSKDSPFPTGGSTKSWCGWGGKRQSKDSPFPTGGSTKSWCGWGGKRQSKDSPFPTGGSTKSWCGWCGKRQSEDSPFPTGGSTKSWCGSTFTYYIRGGGGGENVETHHSLLGVARNPDMGPRSHMGDLPSPIPTEFRAGPGTRAGSPAHATSKPA